MKSVFFIFIFLFAVGLVSSSGCVGQTKTFVCGEDVNESCVLNGDLTSQDTCFNVISNEIVIDCKGHSIIGEGQGYGIEAESGSIIKNCKISNFEYAVSAYRKVSLIENILTKNLYDGAIISNCVGSVFENNIFSENAGSGIVFSSSSKNVFKNNTLKSNSRFGLELGESSLENTFSNNVFIENDYAGVQLEYADKNSFFDNNFSSNSRQGIFVFVSDSLVFERNIFSNNFATGISLESVSNSLFKDNKIIYNGIKKSYSYGDDGISFIDSNNNKLEGNYICFNEGEDLYFFENSLENIEDKNTCDSRKVSNTKTAQGCEFKCSSVNELIDSSKEISSVKIGCVGATKTFICGETISESCILNGDLNAEKACFTIVSDGVTIDCAGHEISGKNYIGSSGIGLNGVNNFSLKNCNLNNFYFGIYLMNSSNINIEKSSFCNSDSEDIYVDSSTYFGVDNFCDKNFGWNDEGFNGCSNSCSGFDSENNVGKFLLFGSIFVGIVLIFGISFYLFKKFSSKTSSLVNSSSSF